MKKYNLHPDFKNARFIHAPTNTFGVELMNRFNEKAIEKMKFDSKLRVEMVQITSEDGALVDAVLMRPKKMKEVLPCLLYFHGGGFKIKASPLVLENLEEYTLKVNCVSLMVDYRLMPRYPFPKGFEDAYAAFEWAKGKGMAYGIDPDRIAVAGASAGGALAAGVAQKARDKGEAGIKVQILIYPVTDWQQRSDSLKKYWDAPVWSARKNRKMWDEYLLGGRSDDIGYASPLYGRSFKGLPRTYIEVAEYDCLRDEGIAYGKALVNAGVEVEIHEVIGGVHGV